MKKKIVILFAVIALIAAAGILIFTRQPETRFEGERISDPGRFDLQFEWMNMTDSEAMAFEEGEILLVSWRIERLTALTGDHPKYLGWVPLERVLNQKPRV